MKRKVLIYYRYFGFTLGGGEYLPLTFVSMLQKTCDVTLALDRTDHFERAVGLIGIPVDLDRLKVVKVMPGSYHATTNNMYQSLYRFRRLRRLAADADVCISLANIMDFGKPGHHFLITTDLGDPGFADYVRSHGHPTASLPTRFRRFVLDGVARPLLGMRSKKALIRDPREYVYPNSLYAESLMKGYYGPFNGTVFLPPTLFECRPADAPRDPLKVLYLGRVSPAKRITDIIDIVGRAREISGLDFTLSLAGRLDEGAFKDKLTELAATRPWLGFAGEKYGEDKARFLLSGTYAIHAMRAEAFGISVTEYMKAGLIPLVPDEGGSCEVVSHPALTYRTPEEAAQILARLAANSAFRDEQRQFCAKRATFFSRAAYQERERDLLERIVGG